MTDGGPDTAAPAAQATRVGLLDLLRERVADPFRRTRLTEFAEQGRFSELARGLLEDPSGIPPREDADADGSEALLRSLLDGIQAGLAVVNTDLRVLYGGRPGERPGPGATACYEALFERHEPCSFCHAREVFETGEPRRTVAEVRRLDGSPAWYEILAFPLKATDGKIRHVIEMTRDVTRERELERELQRSEKLAAVGRLAAGIAHEIKNPLGVIASSADVLANPARPEGQRAEAAEILRSEVDRLSALVSDFLTYARPRPADRRPAHLGRLAARTLAVWAQRARARPAHVLKVEPDLPERPVDADQIHQVILNLLLNAEEAAGPRGRLTVRLARRPDDRVELSVADDGPGIPAETRARIFEPFFTTKARGTGLGLAIVRQIVLAHDGEVEAADRTGGGAVLRVVL